MDEQIIPEEDDAYIFDVPNGEKPFCGCDTPAFCRCDPRKYITARKITKYQLCDRHRLLSCRSRIDMDVTGGAR